MLSRTYGHAGVGVDHCVQSIDTYENHYRFSSSFLSWVFPLMFGRCDPAALPLSLHIYLWSCRLQVSSAMLPKSVDLATKHRSLPYLCVQRDLGSSCVSPLPWCRGKLGEFQLIVYFRGDPVPLSCAILARCYRAALHVGTFRLMI